MLSPMMTVVVLAVLWLIVVVPMFLKHKDDRAGEKSVTRFSGSMHSLSVRRTLANIARPVPNFDEELDTPRQGRRLSRAQTFIPGRGRAEIHTNEALSTRAPQPAAMEAIMYPDRVAKADLSDARLQMMARRRRSLTVLTAGTVIGVGWLMAMGGMVAMLAAAGFSIGLFGYLYFLRSQALRDRARRETRVRRIESAGLRSRPAASGFAAGAVADQLTERLEMYVESNATVRIDDDDVELLGIAETVDLTGLYAEDSFDAPAMRRAV